MQHYYDRKAGAVALQPGDVVMVHTDQFVGKHKVKDQWEEGGFVIVKQLEDWPVYKVQCPPTGNRRNSAIPDSPSKSPHACSVRGRYSLRPCVTGCCSAAIVLNANMETLTSDCDSDSSESERPNSTLLTQQGGDQISHVWINSEFRTWLYTQSESKATGSPQDSLER